MKLDIEKVKEIYDFLMSEQKTVSSLEHANGAFVFGRSDPLVAKKAAEVYNNNLVKYVLVTGGIGKDSGILSRFNVPEAHFQGALMNILYGVPEEKIFAEYTATNGGENCRFGMDKILEEKLNHENLILVVHPTSLMRTSAVFQKTQEQKNFDANLQTTPTDYLFNPKNKLDQVELFAEFTRLIDWPAKDWCIQKDLPDDLVEYVKEVNEKGIKNYD